MTSNRESISSKDCVFYYEIPVRLQLEGVLRDQYREVKLPTGNFLYYRLHTWSWGGVK